MPPSSELPERLRQALLEFAVQLRAAAGLAGSRSLALSKEAGRHTKQGCLALARSSRQGCGFLVARGELVWRRDLLPALQQCMARAQHALEDVSTWEAFRLRDLDDDEGIGDYVNVQFEVFVRELGRLPGPALAALAFLAARLVSTLNAMSEVLIEEMLCGRTALSRACLVTSVAPGCAALYHFRAALAQPPPAAAGGASEVPPGSSSSSSSRSGGGAESAPDAATALVRRARRMPPMFWLAISPSSAVALHASKAVFSAVTRAVLRARLQALALFVALCAAALRAHRGGALSGVLRHGGMPPAVRRGVATAWYTAQKLSRSSWQNFVVYSAALKERLERSSTAPPDPPPSTLEAAPLPLPGALAPPVFGGPPDLSAASAPEPHDMSPFKTMHLSPDLADPSTSEQPEVGPFKTMLLASERVSDELPTVVPLCTVPGDLPLLTMIEPVLVCEPPAVSGSACSCACLPVMIRLRPPATAAGLLRKQHVPRRASPVRSERDAPQL